MLELKGYSEQAGSDTIVPLQCNAFVAPLLVPAARKGAKATVVHVSPLQNGLGDGPELSCITALAFNWFTLGRHFAVSPDFRSASVHPALNHLLKFG